MRPVQPTHASRIDTNSLAALVGNSGLIAVAVADHDQLLFVNSAFNSLFGGSDILIDAPLLNLIAPAHHERVRAAMRIGDGPSRPCIVEAVRHDATAFEVELSFERRIFDGEPLLAVFAQDVTDRCRADAQLSLLAYSDPLTGLGNRAMFADRLRQAALMTRRNAKAFAVIMLDLDGFKRVNDCHGHDAGDFVLQGIASRMLAYLRETDTVARLGGDEFAVLLTTQSSLADVTNIAKRPSELAREPVLVGSVMVSVGASIGIALYPEHAGTVDQLLAAADEALYEAKRR
jgi:diguanylate cyclase (GGDEF)-like protein/PAS domain S-box-containing protein